MATMDQQRELIRYVRNMNEWLESDVRERQNEVRGVSTRIDQLRSDLGLGDSIPADSAEAPRKCP